MRDGIREKSPWTNLRLHTLPGRKDLIALTESEMVFYGHPAEDLARDRLRMAFAGPSPSHGRTAEQASR